MSNPRRLDTRSVATRMVRTGIRSDAALKGLLPRSRLVDADSRSERSTRYSYKARIWGRNSRSGRLSPSNALWSAGPDPEFQIPG
jgi:hypothetical protein